jgi:hypothetical protein
VKTITHGSLSPDISWHLDDEQGRRLANGVYFLKLETAGLSEVGKVVVVD